MSYQDTLTADDLRNVDKNTYIVVKLHDDEYWQQGEGRVSHVKEYESGAVHVVLRNDQGYESRLKIPSDARDGLRLDGAAQGARGLRVDEVLRVNK